MILTNSRIDDALGEVGNVLKAKLGEADLKRAIAPVLELCMVSTKLTAKVLFPERFRFAFSPKIHDKIFNVLDDDSIRKVMVLAPRGIGKTSIVQLAYMARNILFELKKYIVPVSCAFRPNAVNQTESLKRQLGGNPMIKKLFGENLKGEWFSKEQWETNTGICVMPRGSGQQIRGLLYGDYRPDLLIFDDLEDPEAMLSDEQREKQWKWIHEDALLTVDEKGENETWKVVMIGTLLHEASACARILADYEKAVKEGREPDWHVVHLAICDEEFKSNWPEAFSDEKIAKKVENYRRLRMMDTFAREYMNLPVSIDSNFTRDYFHHYDEKNLVGARVENLILMDLAKTVKADSAETAIVVVGIDIDSGRLYIRQVAHGRWHPDEIVDECFRLASHWRVRTIGFEVTGLNEFISYPLANEMHRRGLNFDLIELKARGKKEERVRALLPFYKRGDVHHNIHGGCEQLELQLLSFPRSLRWDIMDALAYIVELLDSGELYFLPEAFGDNPEAVEKEFSDLEEEEGALAELEDDWMVA